MLTLALPLAAAVLVWRRKDLPAWRQAGLVVGGTLVTVFLGWTLLQNRWMGFMECSLAVLALLVAPCVPWPESINGRRTARLPLALLALTVPGWLGYGVLQMRTLAEDPVVHARATLGDMMGAKEAAWNLNLYADFRAERDRPARVMAAPGPSPVLHYYGGVDTVGSYYWENLPGCHVAIDFFNDEGDDAVARRIVRDRGRRFCIGPGNANVRAGAAMAQARTHRRGGDQADVGLPAGEPGDGAGSCRRWLEALPLMDAPMAQAQGMRIYRVVREKL